MWKESKLFVLLLLCLWCGKLDAWTCNSNSCTSRFNSVAPSRSFLTSTKSSLKTTMMMDSNSFPITDNWNKISMKLMPLCFGPDPKAITTTIDDPTAGMTPEQIEVYMNNIGGNICGWPEPVKLGLGVFLNLGLLVLAVQFVVLLLSELYVLAKENEATNVLKRVDRMTSTPGKRSWIGLLAEKNNKWTYESLQQKSLFDFTPPTPPTAPSMNSSPAGNRGDRRLRARFERERENKDTKE